MATASASIAAISREMDIIHALNIISTELASWKVQNFYPHMTNTRVNWRGDSGTQHSNNIIQKSLYKIHRWSGTSWIFMIGPRSLTVFGRLTTEQDWNPAARQTIRTRRRVTATSRSQYVSFPSGVAICGQDFWWPHACFQKLFHMAIWYPPA